MGVTIDELIRYARAEARRACGLRALPARRRPLSWPCPGTGCTAAASPPWTPCAAAQRSPACLVRQEEVPFAHPLAPFPVAKRPSLAPSFADKQEARPGAGAVPATCNPL